MGRTVIGDVKWDDVGIHCRSLYGPTGCGVPYAVAFCTPRRDSRGHPSFFIISAAWWELIRYMHSRRLRSSLASDASHRVTANIVAQRHIVTQRQP